MLKFNNIDKTTKKYDKKHFIVIFIYFQLKMKLTEKISNNFYFTHKAYLILII